MLSKTLFAQFLHQRAEKNSDATSFTAPGKDTEYAKMHKRMIALQGENLCDVTIIAKFYLKSTNTAISASRTLYISSLEQLCAALEHSATPDDASRKGNLNKTQRL